MAVVVSLLVVNKFVQVDQNPVRANLEVALGYIEGHFSLGEKVEKTNPIS